MSKYSVGIDLGGTNLRVGLVDQRGRIIKLIKEPVGTEKSGEAIISKILKIIKKMEPTKNLIKLGIGAAGIVDAERGIVVRSPHFPKWQNVAFKTKLSKALGVPVIVDNDANMIALGERYYGAAKEMQNFIMITIGTGIGGGIIINDKIWHGDRGFAGEIGHITINSNGPLCECGNRGCWETYVSTEGFINLTQFLSSQERREWEKKYKRKFLTSEDIFSLASKGDRISLKLWNLFGKYLGIGIATLVNILGIENIVIGGGVSKAWKFFINPARDEIPKRIYSETARLIKITRAKLGDEAGILGSVVG